MKRPELSSPSYRTSRVQDNGTIVTLDLRNVSERVIDPAKKASQSFPLDMWRLMRRAGRRIALAVTQQVPRHPDYRADIDALRAVAVLLVIGFHWRVPPFTGGFIGVDIFFVISGFLITELLIRKIDRGAFSFAEFYESRCRRIIPALYAVILGTLAIFWFLQTTADYQQLGLSAASAITFSSNMLFWWQAGYFDVPSLEKPLLHTWSLAVEEQFYLILAPVLWVFATWARRFKGLGSPSRLIGIAGMALCSFVGCLWLLGRDPSAAYYFSASRAWEFLFGAFLACKIPCPRTILSRSAAIVVGALVIAWAALSFTEATQFPGFNAVMVCAGASLIIVGGMNAPSMQNSRRMRGFACIGRMSYPMYLWHWPLYIAALDMLDGPQKSSMAVRAVLLAVTMIVSWLSCAYIENPIRQRRVFPSSRGFAIAVGVASLALLALAIVIWRSDGFAGRSEARQIANYRNYSHRALYRQRTCFLEPWQTHANYDKARCYAPAADRKNVLLFGDSQAAHYAAALAGAFPGVNVMQATAAACPPFYTASGGDKFCSPFANDIFELVRAQPPFAVILSSNWPYDASPDHQNFLKRLRESIDIFTALGVRVVVIGPSPQYAETVPRIIVSHRDETQVGAPIAGLFELDREMASALRDIPSVSYLSALTTVCDDETCQLLAKPLVPMQWDRLHLTAEGSQLIVSRLHPKLAEIFGQSR